MELLHPGVFLQEVSSGSKPIEGAGTSTAGFIGKSQMGPVATPTFITSFAEYQTKFGGYLSDSYLTHSVAQFYNNGGKKCYIVRICGSGAVSSNIIIRDRSGSPRPTLTISAKSEGTWGNDLDVVITDGTADPVNEFAVSVYKDQSSQPIPKLPLLLESFDNLSMNSSADNYVEKVINNNAAYIKVNVDTTNLDNAQAGVSRGGTLSIGNSAVLLKLGIPNTGTETPGTAAGASDPATAGTSRSDVNPSTNPPADQRRFTININGDGAQTVVFSPLANTGAAVAAAIQTAVRALTANQPTNQPAYDQFTCAYQTTGSNTYLLTSGTVGVNSSVVVTNATIDHISLLTGDYQFIIHLNGDGPHLVKLSGPIANGVDLSNAIQAAVQGLIPKRNSNADAFNNFNCTYVNGNVEGAPFLRLTSGKAGVASSVRITNGPGSSNIATLLRIGLTNGGIEIGGTASLRPANSRFPREYAGDTEYHLGDAVSGPNIVSVQFGQDGSTPQASDYESAVTVGQSPLDTVRDINILSIPGIGIKSVVSAAANYCSQRMDCFFVGDMDDSDDTPEDARDFINGLTVKNSYAAVYYPWLVMTDPTGNSPAGKAVPPSGFVCGLYAQIDARRGVWKAPAGTEAVIAGISGLVTDTTDMQQDILNPIGVNVIRSFPAAGTVVWGSRTLATRSNPEYRYIPVRRTAIFLEQSIYAGIQWAVFEPNDENLWASLRFNIGAFMMRQFRAGAFQGKSPNDAFYVRCDSKTTTQADIDAGVVNIIVAFAPLKPAEFIVLQLTQKAGGMSA
jgi:phage tail sheath protein FI